MSLLGLRLAQEEDRDLPAAERARRAHARHDALERGPVACAPGCAFCCHLKVELSASEAERILPRVRDEHRARLAENARRARGLTPAEYRLARIRCAFLDEGDRCSIYDVRPLACRAHASFDKGACERNLPTNELPLDTRLTAAAEALRSGLGERAEELHEFLHRRAPA